MFQYLIWTNSPGTPKWMQHTVAWLLLNLWSDATFAAWFDHWLSSYLRMNLPISNAQQEHTSTHSCRVWELYKNIFHITNKSLTLPRKIRKTPVENTFENLNKILAAFFLEKSWVHKNDYLREKPYSNKCDVVGVLRNPLFHHVLRALLTKVSDVYWRM